MQRLGLSGSETQGRAYLRYELMMEVFMFGFFKKDPLKQLQAEYEKKLTAAQAAQRSGDIKTYSELSAEADAIYQKIQQHKTP